MLMKLKIEPYTKFTLFYVCNVPNTIFKSILSSYHRSFPTYRVVSIIFYIFTTFFYLTIIYKILMNFVKSKDSFPLEEKVVEIIFINFDEDILSHNNYVRNLSSSYVIEKRYIMFVELKFPINKQGMPRARFSP